MMVTIIFKPTEDCNSSCIYCDGVANKHRAARMSESLLEKVFFRLNEYLTVNKNEQIQFIWHGGEPLMMGVDFFRKALEFQQHLCLTTANQINHCIQSNLTLLNQDFIAIFRELGINSVGTSYDPVPGVRGLGEKVHS